MGAIAIWTFMNYIDTPHAILIKMFALSKVYRSLRSGPDVSSV